jgi:hypothetical protein
MILTIVIIAVVAGVTYFHYAQGLFGATISATIAIIAASLAIGYHENLINAMLGGAIGDYATAGALVAIFALVYIVLRVITDKAIPGNVRLPLMVDRIGGAVMGLIAGLFTAGIVALVAQSLPFGPTLFARYTLADARDVVVTPPGSSSGRGVDMQVADQLDEDTFVAEKKKKLIIPADDMVLSFVQKLSDGGSLAGARTLESIHPDYPDELFAQRLGVQIGAKRTAFNGKGKAQVTVPDDGVYVVVAPDLTAKGNFLDAELNDLHAREVVPKKSGNQAQLVLRVMFTKDAADVDGNVRVSPASVRLVAGGENVFPVGTLENGQLYANQVDDFLFINVKGADSGADFVFFVNPEDIVAGGASSLGKDAKEAPKVKEGVFVEVKRLARIDLSGKTVGLTPPAKSENVQVERKAKLLEQRKAKAAAAAEKAAAAPAPADPDAAKPAAPAGGEKKNPMQTIREGAAEKEKALNPK